MRLDCEAQLRTRILDFTPIIRCLADSRQVGSPECGRNRQSQLPKIPFFGSWPCVALQEMRSMLRISRLMSSLNRAANQKDVDLARTLLSF